MISAFRVIASAVGARQSAAALWCLVIDCAEALCETAGEDATAA